ncbi:cargo-transport protein YPP1 [Entomortierella parvispora]|uniref:Cargo-transport protein YPP1 n=1 Tax=Entomortierella parvispora TaxID=205924 RepID=A0A9P3LZR9_9FUNG|nr:cargo-transport protein YPP1 [Entomortierella parvispora]
MTLTAKAQVIERDFQLARGRANYSTFPEFARRYVKHYKDGVVLANTALLELAIGEAESQARRTHLWLQSVSLDDTPEVIAVSPRVRPEAIQEAVERLERVLTKGPEEHQEYAAIVLARSAMASDAPDRLQRVAHYLQNIQLPPARIVTGYNFTLIVSGLTIKGMALEEEGRIPDAIVCYDNVAVMLQSNPNERSDELFSWTEHALYRGSMLKLRQGDQLAAIRSFRAYHHQAMQWPGSFRLARRATMYRYYAQTLSASSRANLSNGSATATDDQSQFQPAALSHEMAQIHAYWEDSLYAVTPFPGANEKNWRVLVMVEQIVEDRKLLGSGNNADKRALVETIYRASQKTFQSPRILRFLFFALVDMGQYDEAALALKAYLDMVEINMKVKNDGLVEDDLTHEERVRMDLESEYDITTVQIAGSRLYSKELGKADEGLACAKGALDNIHQYLQQSPHVTQLLSDAYKGEGVAYGLQASKVHDPEKRPDLYSKAIDAFEKAIKVTPGNYDTYYLLALQLAEMRDIPKAILTVKQSLSIHASHIPSWHLLALLLSSQKDYERALSICAIASKESEWDLATTDALSASQLDGEDYLALRITQAVLQDQIHGPESALELQEALFSLYTKVFAPEPSSLGESMYDIQSIRRRDQSDVEVSNATIAGRPRAGSILSSRSRNGTGSDLGHQSTINGNTLDIPKANYASSIASSIGSTGSKNRRGAPQPMTPATPLGRSLLSLPPTVRRPTGQSVMRTARANKVLVTLWLMSASAFRRLGRMDDAMKAIEEAERVDASNPDVWYQLGSLHAAQGDQETASIAFSKALALAPYHAACLARVGRSYLEAGSLEMAEGALDTTTRSMGWDCAEAWFYLGKVFEASNQLSKSKECLWYALDLESTRPVRPFTEALPRFLS